MIPETLPLGTALSSPFFELKELTLFGSLSPLLVAESKVFFETLFSATLPLENNP